MTRSKLLIQSGSLSSSIAAEFWNVVSLGLAVQTHGSGLIDVANNAFASLHGYAATELHGISSEALIAEIDRAEWRQALDLSLSGGGGFSLEVHRLRKDGSQFPSLVKFTPMSGEFGDVDLLEVYDREERNSLTEALNEERDLLIRSFQQLPVPMLVFAPDLSRVLVASEAFSEMFPAPSRLAKTPLRRAHQAIAKVLRQTKESADYSGLRVPSHETGMSGNIALQAKQILNSAGKMIALAVVVSPV
jgi:PAS domain S-box-containing protein